MTENNKVVCIVQARMDSSRLPGKVLLDICGAPMLDWVVSRAGRAKMIDDLIVATTTSASDDPVVEWCKENRVQCFRGAPYDVLDRYYQAAKESQADIIIRITADCPLIDPDLIDELLKEFFKKKADFATNRLPPPYKRTYPIGLDIEIASFSALERAWREATEQFEREHVMPFLYSVEGRFRVFILDAEENHGARRWTVDTPEDLEFIKKVLGELDCRNDFTWRDVAEVLDKKPELEKINAGIIHKTLKDVDERG